MMFTHPNIYSCLCFLCISLKLGTFQNPNNYTKHNANIQRFSKEIICTLAIIISNGSQVSHDGMTNIYLTGMPAVQNAKSSKLHILLDSKHCREWIARGKSSQLAEQAIECTF